MNIVGWIFAIILIICVLSPIYFEGSIIWRLMKGETVRDDGHNETEADRQARYINKHIH